MLAAQPLPDQQRILRRRYVSAACQLGFDTVRLYKGRLPITGEFDATGWVDDNRCLCLAGCRDQGGQQAWSTHPFGVIRDQQGVESSLLKSTEGQRLEYR